MSATTSETTRQFSIPDFLSQDEQQALLDYLQFLLERFPGEIVQVVLFGSRARGAGDAESDLDLLIVTTTGPEPDERGMYSPGSTEPLWQEAVGYTFDLLMRHHVFISPTLMSRRRFQRWSPLTAHIHQDGIELWKKSA